MSSKYNPEVVSYEACLKKLDDLGWEKDDPLYGIAIALLTDNGNREAWMTIPEATAKVWVKAVGKKDGYMLTFEEEMMMIVLIYIYIYIYVRRRRIASERIERMPDNTSALSGYAYTQELLTGSSTQCQELMRLSQKKNWLKDSRYVSVEEKMAMFLTMIGHNERYRVIKRRFQHSTRTVHKCFHEVLLAMFEFAKEMVVPTTSDTTSNMSSNHRRLRDIFPGAIGALDGTLIHAVVPASHQTAFRGRGGGRCYQNVLGICDFNMIFTFVWAGWEGIAHDSRILREVAFNPRSGFPFPPQDKYYLCDAAYANARGFLAPYRNTRYWLADFRRRRALTREEKFNHAHAQLRNVIERAYGVLKARFPILKQMAPFPFTIQRNVVFACVAIHNFIRKYNIQDQLFMEINEDTIFNNEEEAEGSGEEELDISQWGANSTEYMATLRDGIANSLVNNA
ncbi:hypothetical protein OSB04_018895 [Centaurea solstitialis]|uniref:DDE Tnp4 domain-containing protein n=1 Tax=Centaurea solstitialis TaxID=347529 RepID=A0AA38W2B9_9ASTR|nr:hypothetical protein OSB04_018895 [Centaurea solstitialis]